MPKSWETFGCQKSLKIHRSNPPQAIEAADDARFNNSNPGAGPGVNNTNPVSSSSNSGNNYGLSDQLITTPVDQYGRHSLQQSGLVDALQTSGGSSLASSVAARSTVAGIGYEYYELSYFIDDIERVIMGLTFE
jgi:hypothetical protein